MASGGPHAAFFSAKDDFKRNMPGRIIGVSIDAQRRSAPRFLRAMEQLAEASLDMRRNAALAEAIAQRTLLSIAVAARRREP